MTFVFLKLRLKSHYLQYFSKESSFSCNPFSVRENVATVFEIRTFHLVGYFSGKAEEPLNQNKRSKKSAMGVGVTVTYAHSVSFVYFVIQIV